MRAGSYRNTERARALVALAKAGVPADVARLVLRDAAKLARLAEAQCNGDWPADNGQRKTAPCDLCHGHWAPSSMTKYGHTALRGDLLACQECRATERIKERLKPYVGSIQFNGDPRGFVVVAKTKPVVSDDGRERSQEIGLA